MSALRREAGVTQAEMAARLSMTQSGVSQLERRSDVLLSTLVDYLTALGAQAHITITVSGQTVTHNLTGGKK